MFDEELSGATVVLAVAQKLFEHPNESGIWNSFASLIPVLHEDGRRAEPDAFPSNGSVWWMIVPPKRDLAEPGRLLTGTLEPSRNVGHPGKSWYQVRVDGIEPTQPSQFVELVEVPAEWASEPRGLVSGNRTLRLDHRPLHVVHALWRGHVYGPLRAVSEPASEDTGDWLVKFSPADAENAVLQLPETFLDKIPPNRNHRLNVKVSLTNEAPERVTRKHTCRYHLVPAEDFRAVIPGNATRLVLQSDESILGAAAKQLLTRSKRQQLLSLLNEMLAAEAGARVTAGTTEVIRALCGRAEAEDRYAEKLADALLESGALAGQIERAKERAEAEHVKKHAARLQAEIDEKIYTARADLAELDKRKQQLVEETEALRRKGLAEVEREQARKRQEFEQSLRSEAERLDHQRRELERQRDLLSKNLQQVSAQFIENQDNLVNQFLAISPLLRQLDLIPAGRDGVPAAQAAAAVAKPRPSFRVPAFAGPPPPAPPVSEVEFFNRFCKHVEASGFKHRRLDLAAFHLSLKCNDLTILGGLPGTGKSSLPRLYAEALAGSQEEEDGVLRYLHVGVSPSWLDMRDLLGHTNALDRCFQPAESGLYQHLIRAQEEEAQRGLDSRLYLVCLDEMNLAQVEHYFSGFIQALERPPGMREVPCFSPEVVSEEDPFARWPTLRLPGNLRFVGTVNFDETTRQLSQRVLDRANLIRLRPPDSYDAKDPAPARAAGGGMTLRQFDDWVDRSPKLDRSLGELIDKLREPLARLGCPLNPRRLKAIRKFVSSAPPEICKPEESLDLQLAQRVLPQVRNLFRPGARDALAAVKKVLESHPAGFPESLYWLEEELRAAAHPGGLFAGGIAE